MTIPILITVNDDKGPSEYLSWVCRIGVPFNTVMYRRELAALPYASFMNFEPAPIIIYRDDVVLSAPVFIAEYDAVHGQPLNENGDSKAAASAL